MAGRFRRLLRRGAIFCFSLVVLVLIVIEDVLRFAGFLLQKILPANVEEFLRRQSNAFAFGLVGVATALFVSIKVWELYAFTNGQFWTTTFLVIFSKVYFVFVLGYLCRVYSDRLLANTWIRAAWELYGHAKEYMKSFNWYKAAHALVLRMKAKLKAFVATIREKFDGPSFFATIWRTIRAKYRRQT